MNKQIPNKLKSRKVISMTVVNPYAAGIDISDKEHVVALPDGISEKRTYAFGTMTCDLLALADLLLHYEINTVAMESTGVYWKPLFSMLIEKGFEVYLVNAAHVKNVSGRKDDENDAMWLQKLHSCGLLRTSYLPDSEQESLRTLVRYRRTLVQDSSRFINRMQKSLELMNIKFHTLIRDITGNTGRAVVEAIISGERCAENFLPFIDYRVKASHDEIIKSLQGNWKPEHLFTLTESYQMYVHYKTRIDVCDKEIEKYLQRIEAMYNGGELTEKEIASPKIFKRKDRNHPKINIRQYLHRIHGIDVLDIYGLSETGGLELLAETGTDLSKWKNEKHFVSWLNICPNNKQSGGKIISSKIQKKRMNAACQAFKHAANAVQKSNNWLGDYFRRMKTKGGNKYAITATANKIAQIYYKMVRYKQAFTPVDIEQYQQKYKQAKIAFLERKLDKLKKETA